MRPYPEKKKYIIVRRRKKAHSPIYIFMIMLYNKMCILQY